MQDFSAAFLIIGNEILSGRTLEKNLSVLAHLLNERGWRLLEARIVADDGQEIAEALNALRQRYAMVFTSGGIGSTHDDITTDSIAAALELPVAEHPLAVDILEKFYQSRGAEFTAARRRMARMPQGAQILNSRFPGAPAYQINNIVVCAGVPAIFMMMAEAAVEQLPMGTVRTSQTLRVYCGETTFSDYLMEVDAAFPAVDIGSYPHEENGTYICEIIFSGSDSEPIAAARQMFCDYLQREQLRFDAL